MLGIPNEAKEAFMVEQSKRKGRKTVSTRPFVEEVGDVVDGYDSVHGVHNLIVADAQILPFTVDGNHLHPHT